MGRDHRRGRVQVRFIDGADPAHAEQGQAGLVRTLELLEEEIRICLALLGVSRIGAVDKSYLHPAMPVVAPHVSSAFPLMHEGY